MLDPVVARGDLPRRAGQPVLLVTPTMAGCLVVALALLAQRQAHACDHHQDQRIDILGTSRGQLVLLVADESFDRWCPAHRKGTGTGNSYLRYELRFATLSGQWLPRRIPVEKFVSGKALYATDLPGKARRKALGLAAKLPGYTAVPVPADQKCTDKACGSAVTYEEDNTPPRLVLNTLGGRSNWTAELKPNTPAGDAVRRLLPPGSSDLVDPVTYLKGNSWLLWSLRRYRVGASELLVLQIGLFNGASPTGKSGPFEILVPTPPVSAPRPVPAQPRPASTRR